MSLPNYEGALRHCLLPDALYNLAVTHGLGYAAKGRRNLWRDDFPFRLLISNRVVKGLFIMPNRRSK